MGEQIINLTKTGIINNFSNATLGYWGSINYCFQKSYWSISRSYRI